VREIAIFARANDVRKAENTASSNFYPIYRKCNRKSLLTVTTLAGPRHFQIINRVVACRRTVTNCRNASTRDGSHVDLHVSVTACTAVYTQALVSVLLAFIFTKNCQFRASVSVHSYISLLSSQIKQKLAKDILQT